MPSNSYKIETDVPPPPLHGAGPPPKYPLGKLQVGQSFLAPRPEAARIRAAAFAMGKRHGKRFVSRIENGAVRIWRVA